MGTFTPFGGMTRQLRQVALRASTVADCGDPWIAILAPSARSSSVLRQLREVIMQINGPSRDELIAEVLRLSESFPIFAMPKHKVTTMPTPDPESDGK